MCTTGLLFTDNFQKQKVLPRGVWPVSLCLTFTMHFWAHNTALHWRRGSPLISATRWVPALSWLHRSSRLPGLSTVLTVHLWRLHCPHPTVPLYSTSPQPPLHTAEKSSHFIFPVQSTETCMRTYLPAWRRVAQTSPMGEQCSEYGVAIYVLILKTKLEKWPREQWQNFSSLLRVIAQKYGNLNSWFVITFCLGNRARPNTRDEKTLLQN